MLTFRQLEAFKAVMDAGTVVRAAESLRLSQPAVSRLLSDLESGIGLRLFDRRKGRLTPRQEAVELSGEVDRCFVGLDQIAEAAQSIRHRTSKHLRMASLPSFTMGVVGGVVAQFICLNPSIGMSVEVRSRSQMLEGIGKGRHDIGLATWGTDDPAIGVRHLASLELMCLVPSRHPLAERDVITFGDLDGVDCVLGTVHTPTRQRLDEAFRTAGARPRIRLQVATIYSAIELVAEGVGVTVGLRYIHDRALAPTIRAMPLRPAILVDLVAFYPAAQPLEGAAGDLVDMYAEAAQSWQRGLG